MNGREYIDATFAVSPTRLDDTTHRRSLYALGIAGEAGEVCEVIKKHLFHDRPLDVELLLKEVGDVLWYCARLVHDVTEGERDLGDVMALNIAKLAARHPNGWQPHYQSDRQP